MSSDPGATPHRAKVAVDIGGHDEPVLFGSECSCGWRSDFLRSDPEAAEMDAVNHELEAEANA